MHWHVRDDGVAHIAVLSDDLPNLPEGDFPSGVAIHPREHIDRAMEEFWTHGYTATSPAPSGSS